MPFVPENPSQAQAAPIIKKVIGTIYQIEPIWVRDAERDLVLIDLGGKGKIDRAKDEPPSYYNLIWRGMPISFSGWHKLFQDADFVQIKYTLVSFAVPSAVANDLEFIKSAIVEGLAVYWTGSYGRPIATDAVFPLPEFYPSASTS